MPSGLEIMPVPGIAISGRLIAAPLGRLMPSGRIDSVPGLVWMGVPTGRLVPSGRIMSQIMLVPGFVISGRLMAVPAWSLPCPAWSYRGGSCLLVAMLMPSRAKPVRANAKQRVQSIQGKNTGCAQDYTHDAPGSSRD